MNFFQLAHIGLMKKIKKSDESESFNNLNFNHNLTESDIINFDVKPQLEHQNQIRETKDSGWMFDKINSMTIRFHKTGEYKSSSYVEISVRSNATLNIENNDRYCFLWSTLAYSHPYENRHPSRVKNYKQNFDELNIAGFDITNGFKGSDVPKK